MKLYTICLPCQNFNFREVGGCGQGESSPHDSSGLGDGAELVGILPSSCIEAAKISLSSILDNGSETGRVSECSDSGVAEGISAKVSLSSTLGNGSETSRVSKCGDSGAAEGLSGSGSETGCSIEDGCSIEA